MIGIKSRADFVLINTNSSNSHNNSSSVYASQIAYSGMSNVDIGSTIGTSSNNSSSSQFGSIENQLQNSLNSVYSLQNNAIMSSSANDDLKEKKRKMMLPLSGPGSSGSGQSASNGTTPNESKRSKILVTPNVANYVQDTLDLSTSNMLTTPQLEKFITELGTNPTLLKTPDSALGLLTPATSSLFFGSLGTTPMNAGGNANDSSSAYSNIQGSSGANLGSNLLMNRSTGLTPNYANINPSDIFMNASVNQQQQSQANNMDYMNSNNKYAVLTNVNDGSAANMMTMQSQQTENMMSSGVGMHGSTTGTDMNTADYKIVKLGPKDEPQTVPVSSNKLMANMNNMTMVDNTNNNSWSTTATTNNQTSSTKKRNNSSSGKSKGGGKKGNESMGQQSTRLNHLNQSSADVMTMSSSRHDMHSNASSVASSMSMMNESYSPIDPNDQDKQKVEKKRERNREAARKCRTRKLEKIAELTLQVKELTNSNQAEREKSIKLSQEIEELKARIRQHKNHHGCDLNINL